MLFIATVIKLLPITVCVGVGAGNYRAGGNLVTAGLTVYVTGIAVIMAIGTSPTPLIKNTTPSLEVNRRGGIVVEEGTGATSRAGVYAGGDAVTGAATVISAMGAGKSAAHAIHEHLSSKNVKM